MASRKFKATSTKFSSKRRFGVSDAFANEMARLGHGTQSILEYTRYPSRNLTADFGLLNSLYRSNWIIQNIISMIPDDMVKNWYKVRTEEDPLLLKQYVETERGARVRDSVLEGLKWGRLYGGCLGIMLIAGHEKEMMRPLNHEDVVVGSFRGLFIADRHSGVMPSTQLVEDIVSPNFGMPLYYTVSTPNGEERYDVHHSRCVRFIGRELPYRERMLEQHWGQSEVEAIYDEVVKRDNASFSIANLIFKANMVTRELQDLDQLLALGGSKQIKRFWDMLQALSVIESNFGVRAVNKGDSVSQQTYSFAGLSDVYEAIITDVAGASRIPLTKLFGQSPRGLNATGESDLQNYEDYVDELKEKSLRPIVEKLMPVIAMSTWGRIPEGITAEFVPLRQPDPSKRAEIGQRKVDLLVQAFTAGGIDCADFLRGLKKIDEVDDLFSHIGNDKIESREDIYYNQIKMGEEYGMLGGTDPFLPEPIMNAEKEEP